MVSLNQLKVIDRDELERLKESGNTPMPKDATPRRADIPRIVTTPDIGGIKEIPVRRMDQIEKEAIVRVLFESLL